MTQLELCGMFRKAVPEGLHVVHYDAWPMNEKHVLLPSGTVLEGKKGWRHLLIKPRLSSHVDRLIPLFPFLNAHSPRAVNVLTGVPEHSRPFESTSFQGPELHITSISPSPVMSQ